MNEKNILVELPIEERHKKKMKDAYPNGNFIYKKPTEIEDLKDINIIIGNVSASLLSAANKLEWIQLSSAGADGYIKEGIIKEGTLLTNATGAFGTAMSEYLLAGTLSLIKRLNQYQINQVSHKWKREGMVNLLYGSHTLIVGLGDIGSEYGKRMKAMGSYVVGIKKHIENKPDWIDELYNLDSLEDELAKADIVALTLPNNPSTYHLMDINKFLLMKKNAILLNVGRGNAIVSDDLCKALNDEMIFGACLDVTDPEPLPPEHPLWDAKNIIITPHVSGQSIQKETFEKIIQIVCENLRLFSSGKNLNNIVDFKTGYRKHT